MHWKNKLEFFEINSSLFYFLVHFSLEKDKLELKFIMLNKPEWPSYWDNYIREWRPSQIARVDDSGRVQVRVMNSIYNCCQFLLFWSHLNDRAEIAPFQSRPREYLPSGESVIEGITLFPPESHMRSPCYQPIYLELNRDYGKRKRKQHQNKNKNKNRNSNSNSNKKTRRNKNKKKKRNYNKKFI